MSKLCGDWYHSRTGSQLSELAAIQLLVANSNRWAGKLWGADRHNPKNKWIYAFSNTAKIGNKGIEPSTMQTKIRNWIRLGFLKDNTLLPLRWTVLGKLWNEAVNEGNSQDAHLLYNLIIANAISLISFSPDSVKYDNIPHKDYLAVRFLITVALQQKELSKDFLEYIIDGNTKRKKALNYSYWMSDLVNSGLFIRDDKGGLLLNDKKFQEFITAIYKFNLKKDYAIQEIKDNPLAHGAPFADAIRVEVKLYGSKTLIEKISILSELDLVPAVNNPQIIKENKQADRSATWSKEIKEDFNYKCAIPECDAEGSLFVEAAHIMPFSVEKEKNNHRTDLQNGVSLCYTCHKMFDAGLFTFDNKGDIKISNFIYSSKVIGNCKQTNVQKIIKSNKELLINPNDISFKKEYTDYHTTKIFLGE
ncbi:HNH endonuclease signature motif containing protein [Lactobacillus amylovorus]|uniref:HNH endonuclease signature motif containing protein n=1 Tax=Lactobacillus amylovorus TaxID=1604 RepID=UPI00232E1A34|nr:HNH endonuclease signature motif containing protein [Lactobacillus amylovorus]MDB6242121.1 HNH endonuclease [Lactobacillus amylovorus]MDB6251585.1 HNH endonuclease [Lactobacillus amylovorus]